MKARTHRPLFMLALLAGMAALLLAAAPGLSYLPDFTAPGPQPDHWDFAAFPVTWNLNPSTSSNLSGSRSVADVMQSSFNTWTGAPNAALSVTRGADSAVSSEGASPSNINLICFVCTDADFAKDSTTLAVTITTTANAAGEPNGHNGTTTFVGQLLKADIAFNPASKFTTDGSCPSGATCQDLQTVATHEVGHFFGLDHSGVVRAVMFPAASSLVTLSYDDIAGLSVLYPKSSPDVATGSISGTVTMSGGAGIFGAHVFAESVSGNTAFGSNIRKSPVGTLTRPDGTYNIQGLPADSYIVVAEPLDGPVMNSDVSGYPAAFGQPSVQTNFTTRYH
ncbi:MAG: matrixin family metalloprotease [Terriglobales bacterium]